MKSRFLILIFFIFSSILSGCEFLTTKNEDTQQISYRQEMRDFVKDISSSAKKYDSSFLVVPQNAQALITDTGDENGKIYSDYINSIDGSGRESLFYGYKNSINRTTPEKQYTSILNLCSLIHKMSLPILITDYCKDKDKVDDSYRKNNANGFISFAADTTALNTIPSYPVPLFNENSEDIKALSDAKNFLYILDNEKYKTKENLINTLSQTNYDLIIMDLFIYDDLNFSKEEILRLKKKKNGGKRIVLAYMSIGEAENYRYYWKKEWEISPPAWLMEENPDWRGNFKVKYWEKEWQDIIYGNENSYLKKVMYSGFDGVYLDRVDAYEYFQ